LNYLELSNAFDVFLKSALEIKFFKLKPALDAAARFGDCKGVSLEIGLHGGLRCARDYSAKSLCMGLPIWRQFSTVKTGHKPDVSLAVSRSIRRRVSCPVASLKPLETWI
jgi:hypothetical protein